MPLPLSLAMASSFAATSAPAAAAAAARTFLPASTSRPLSLAGRIPAKRAFRRGRFSVCNVAAPAAAEQVPHSSFLSHSVARLFSKTRGC
jgi:magnesium chelatase subunit I